MNEKDKRNLFIIEEKMKCGYGINENEYEIARSILIKQIEFHLEEIKSLNKRIAFLSKNVGGYDGCKEL